MSSDTLSKSLEREIGSLVGRWVTMSDAGDFADDLRKFARTVEEERDKHWHEQLLNAGTKIDRIVEEELGANAE